jgi:four helix bundle protein
MGYSFEDLEVWKKSCRLSVFIYRLLKDCRDYGLKDQILRSSISIPSNIAEGSERKSVPDFQRFINISLGSAAELRTQIYIAKEVNMFSNSDAKEIIQELKTISRMLQSLYNSLNR